MNHTQNATLVFDAPDLSTLRQAKKFCNAKMIDAQALHIKTDYLAEHVKKIGTVNSALNEADFYLTSAAQKISIELNTIVRTVADLQQELAQTTDDTERKEILQDLAQTLGTVTNVARSNTDTLASHLRSVRTSFDRTATTADLAKSEREVTRLTEETVQLLEQKAVLDAERATLTSTLDALESKNLNEVGKEAILNVESLYKAGLASPEVAAAQAALELLKKAQEELSIALNYFGLVSLRDHVRGRIDKLLDTTNAKNAELALVKDRITLIETLHGFDEERLVYTDEFSKIVVVLEMFLDQSEVNAADVDESADVLIHNATALIDYLKHF